MTRPSKVSHEYHDLSSVVETDRDQERLRAIYGDLGRDEQTFPHKLHYILSQPDAHDLGEIISWQPHGRCFIVHDRTRLQKEVLPTWFRQSAIASFVRQLNLYGFKRLTRGPDRGAYYHELFLRGKPFLIHYLKRTRVKGEGGRKPSSPLDEPNFYAMPFLSEPRSTESHATDRPLGHFPTVQRVIERPLILADPFLVRQRLLESVVKPVSMFPDRGVLGSLDRNQARLWPSCPGVRSAAERMLMQDSMGLLSRVLQGYNNIGLSGPGRPLWDVLAVQPRQYPSTLPYLHHGW